MKLSEIIKNYEEYGMPRHSNESNTGWVEAILFYLFNQEVAKENIIFENKKEMFKAFIEFENNIIEEAYNFLENNLK